MLRSAHAYLHGSAVGQAHDVDAAAQAGLTDATTAHTCGAVGRQAADTAHSVRFLLDCSRTFAGFLREGADGALEFGLTVVGYDDRLLILHVGLAVELIGDRAGTADGDDRHCGYLRAANHSVGPELQTSVGGRHQIACQTILGLGERGALCGRLQSGVDRAVGHYHAVGALCGHEPWRTHVVYALAFLGLCGYHFGDLADVGRALLQLIHLSFDRGLAGGAGGQAHPYRAVGPYALLIVEQRLGPAFKSLLDSCSFLLVGGVLVKILYDFLHILTGISLPVITILQGKNVRV